MPFTLYLVNSKFTQWQEFCLFILNIHPVENFDLFGVVTKYFNFNELQGEK